MERRQELYRLCAFYGIPSKDMASVLRYEFGILGESRTWDAETLARAEAAVKVTGFRFAETRGQFDEARREFATQMGA